MSNFFDPHQRATIAAAMARIIPTDRHPGCHRGGHHRLPRWLPGGIDRIYAKPDGSGFETLTGRRAQAWQQRVDILRTTYTEGIADLDRRSRDAHGKPFVDLDADQQDDVLAAIERPGEEEAVNTRKPSWVSRPSNPRCSRPVSKSRPRVSSPCWPCTPGRASTPIRSTAATADHVGWQTIGFPGTELTGRGAHRPLQPLEYFADGTQEPEMEISLPITQTRAHRCLHHRRRALRSGRGQGVDRARLPRGRPGARPLADRETFGGDELANVNRYNLWPDPLLNPRTYAPSADETPRSSCSARCRRWSAAAQCTGRAGCRGSPRRISGCARSSATCPAPRSPTGPSPTTSWSRTTAKVEWAFGVSGLAGAKPTRDRAAGATPARRCRCPAMRRSSTRAQEAGLERLPDAAGGAVASVQRPPSNGNQRLRPAARRPDRDPVSALNVFIPDALATGRYDLRPDSYVRELAVDGQGRIKAAVYQNADGDMSSRTPICSSWPAVPSRRRGCCSCRNPAAFQRSRQRQRHGRPQCHLPRVQRRGRPVRRPDLRLGRRRLCQRQHVRVLRARRAPRLRRRRPHRLPPASASRCRSTGPARATDLGRGRQAIDREFFNHSMAVAMVVHDMPQHDNRVELDDKVVDAWGLPVARITLAAPERPRHGR